MINKLFKLFGYKLVKHRNLNWKIKQPEHEIEEAFEHDGIKYYKFVNGMDMYYRRYMAAMDAIMMLESRVDSKFIKLYNESFAEYFNKQDWKNLANLQMIFWQRCQWVTNEELLFTLAAVVFFDDTENCYDYNYEYAEIKKKRWKGDSAVLGKFLQMDLLKLVPSVQMSKETMEKYLLAANQEDLKTLNYLLSTLSEKNGQSALASSIRARLQELQP